MVFKNIALLDENFEVQQGWNLVTEGQQITYVGPQLPQAALHAGIVEGLLGVQAGLACRRGQCRDGRRAALGVTERGGFRPLGQCGDQLRVMGAFLVGIDAFVLHVLHAEQAQRMGGVLQVAVLVGEIPSEGLLQGGLRILGGQGRKHGLQLVRDFRKIGHDAYNFNWLLKIDSDFQKPFVPTHKNMRSLKLHKDQPSHSLAANLRRAFSGMVAGNVKAEGIREIEKHGRFEISGDPAIMGPIDALLRSFVDQQRMKLPGREYDPCYRIVHDDTAA